MVDSLNYRIRRIDFERETVSTIAVCDTMKPVDGDATMEAAFDDPSYLAVHGSTMYVSDTLNNAILKIENGMVSTFATGFDHPLGITVDGNGDVLVADSWNSVIKRIGSKDGSIHVLPPIRSPVAITMSPDGVLYASNYKDIYRLDDCDWKVVTRTDGSIKALKSDSSARSTIHSTSLHQESEVTWRTARCLWSPDPRKNRERRMDLPWNRGSVFRTISR